MSYFRIPNIDKCKRGNVEMNFLNKMSSPKEGFYFECGATDGFILSNTAILERDFNWTGILVEANTHLYDQLKQNRPNNICVNACISDREKTVKFLNQPSGGMMGHSRIVDNNRNENTIDVKTKTITSILRENDAPHLIDYGVIDIENCVLQAIMGIDFHKYNFKFLAIEFNDHDEQDWDHIKNILEESDYTFIQSLADNSHIFRYNAKW
jgi:FkbM family methyltransferase